MRLIRQAGWSLAAVALVVTTPLTGFGQGSNRGALEITSITPSGTNVPPGRQIVIQFNRAVVPLGRMERDASELPITITPALACQWRWLDPTALACQLDGDAALAPATRYSLEIGATLAAQEGTLLAAPRTHSFETQRPSAEYAYFDTWRGPGTPVVRVIFNVPVTAASVREHVYITARGQRHALAVEPDPNDRELPRFVPLPGERAIVDFGGRQTDSPDDRPVETDGGEARRIWLASPVEALGADTPAELRVEPGLQSPAGPEPGDERRVIVAFDTFPEYRLIGLVCTANDRRAIRIDNGASRSAATEADSCNPLQPVGLEFSAPTINSEVRQHVAITPDLAGGRSDYDPWANRGDYSLLGTPHRRGQTYIVWLPERLRAAEVYRVGRSAAGDGPRDEFGRAPAAPIEIEFRTDHRPPNYDIVHSTAVIEAQIDSDVPLYVTNLESATLEYRRVTSAGSEAGFAVTQALPDVEDIQYGVPLGIRAMLDGRTGALYGRVTTNPPVAKSIREQTLFAQVTPYQVHVKLGHYNTLVWVTDLASGAAVAEASVTIYVDRISELAADFTALATAQTDRSGVALLAGAEQLDPELELLGYACERLLIDDCPRLFVRVERGGNVALLPLEQRFEVSPYRVSNYTVFNRNLPKFGHLHSWGTTAQGVYRAGDTMQFKLYVRDQSNETYVAPPTGPYSLDIVDPTGTTVQSIDDIELSEFGAFDGTYDIPESAAVGWYQFLLRAEFAEVTRIPMRVLVTDFTPAAFRVATSINGDTFVAGSHVVTETRASLFSGGPYGNADARITATVSRRTFRSEHPLAAGFVFDNVAAAQTLTIAQLNERIDASGELRVDFTIPATLGEQIVYGGLSVESAVRDDRGRNVANAANARFLAVDRLVGLRNSNWIYTEGEPAEIEYIVVGPDGMPVAGTAVQIQIQRLETKAARVQGAGNAYLTEFVNEWLDVERCDVLSSATAGRCTFVPDAPGRYRATARIADTRGRPHAIEIGAWVAGRGQVVWSTGDDDALQIVPEQTRYRVGDTARYLIQNPYPGAHALVTIERYGVLRQWTQTLETSTPLIEFEVEPDFMPGYFLSVLVMSPRIDAPPPAFGELDLGKPSFKLGLVSVPVADPYKQIDVDVRVESDVYRPRDTVRVAIDARPLNRDESEPIEAAIVVLDEAVLDLIQGGTAYFDPYTGFNTLDGLDVRNFGLLTRLVGRQGLELKGANPGGDGGAALSMRTLLEYVAYWNPSVALSRRGRGEVEFTLPDNLTGWRVLVLAMTPTDRMGLGQGELIVNLPTEIRPVMPNQVTEGDRFLAGFSVMNRTDRGREIRVRIQATGDVREAAVHEQLIALAPFERTTVTLPLEAARLALERNTSEGRIVLEARAFDASDGDALRHALPVRKQRSLQTAASFGSIVDGAVVESLLIPERIHTDTGEIGIDLSASVIGNVEGAFRHAREIRYIGWEQQLTKAVLASHYEALRAYVGAGLEWPDSGSIPARTLGLAANYQAPNGGMAFFVPRDEYVSPYLSAYTALALNWLEASGHAVPAGVETRLHDYLDALLKRSVMPDFYSRGMASTVRAVALAALAAHGRVTLADIERYREAVEQMSLFGKAHYLLAARAVDGGQEIALEVAEIIGRSSVRSAGKLSFNEILDDGYLRILATPLRANCAVLSALVTLGDGASADGLFELVRTVTESRGNRDHWENTQENVFCTNALIDYARRYEAAAPQLEAVIGLDDAELGRVSFDGFTGDAATFASALTPSSPGRAHRVEITRNGTGRLYYAARVSYASIADAEARVNAGIDVRRELSVQRDGEWILLNERASIARGELVRVDLFVSLPTARHFVVVEDPVPGGLEPVDRNLANASLVDADAGAYRAAGGSWWFQFGDWQYYNVSRWSFHHQEMRHDSVRFYSDYLPPGNYHLSYTAQAIAEGQFMRLPVRAEETYDPDLYGIGVAGSLTVGAP